MSPLDPTDFKRMEGLDTLTMSYMTGSPASTLTMMPTDALSMSLLPLDGLDMDQHSNFDTETYAGSEDANQFQPHPLHGRTPSLQRYSSQYDEAFSDVVSNHGSQAGMPQDPASPEDSTIDRDHKLLSFSIPGVSYTILDYAFRHMSMSLTAQLHGMFFLAESPWATTGEAHELTCYRRNLFQVTGNLMLPRGLRYIITEHGEQMPIVSQELTISATESVEGNPVKLISVPWKTLANGPPVPEDKTEKEPASVPLDLMATQEMESDFVSFPVAWKRLQFRVATANNGRRKELQQHFVLHLRVMARLANGAKISICEVHSGAIIVRGRSPRNFQSRKDTPISRSTSARKHNLSITPPRSSTADPSIPKLKQEPRSAPPQTVDIPPLPFAYEESKMQHSPDFFDWKMSTHSTSGALSAIPQAPTSFAVRQQSAPVYAQSSPDLLRPSQKRSAPDATDASQVESIKGKRSVSPLSAAEECERPRKMARLAKPATARQRAFPLNVRAPQDESADPLYEYFPLGLDDWMPTMDAAYRPHVLHNTTMAADPIALGAKNTSKSYFSEDQPNPQSTLPSTLLFA